MIIDSDNLRLHSNIRLISKFIQADINSLPISSQISFSVSGDTFRDTRPGSARLTNNTFLSVDGVKSDVRTGEASLQTRFTFSYKQYYDLIFDIRLMSNPYIEGHDIEFKMSEGFVYDELTQCYSEEQTALVWRVPYRGRMSVSSSLQQDTQGYRQRYSGPINYQTTMTIGPIRGVLNPAAGATLLFPLSQLQKFIGTRTRSFIQKNLETSAAFSQKPGLGFILRGRRSGGNLQFSTSASGKITAQQRSRASVQTNFLFQAAGGIKGPLIPGRYSISASFNATGYREKKFVGPVNYQTNTQFTANYSPQKTWEYTKLNNFTGREYVIRGEEFFDGNALYDISNGSVIRTYTNSIGGRSRPLFNTWYNTNNNIQMTANYVAMVNSSNLVRVLDKTTGSIVRDFTNPISDSTASSIGLGNTHLAILYTKNETFNSRLITIGYVNIYNIQTGLEVSSTPYISGGQFPPTYPGWNGDNVWGMVTNNGICAINYNAYTGFSYNSGTQYGPIEPKEPTLTNGTNTYPFYQSFFKIFDLNNSTLDYNLRPQYTNRSIEIRNYFNLTDSGRVVTREVNQNPSTSTTSYSSGYEFNSTDVTYQLYFTSYNNTNVLSTWSNPTTDNGLTTRNTFGNLIRPENYYNGTNLRSYYKYNYGGSGLTDNSQFQAIYANDEYHFIKIIKQPITSGSWPTDERNVLYVIRTSDNTLFDVINEGRIATQNEYSYETNDIYSNVTDKYFIAGVPNSNGLGIRIFRNTTKP